MLESLLQEHRVLLVAVALLARAGLAWQTQLSWYEYRILHGLKRLVLPVLNKRVPVSLINDKGGKTDAEHVTTRDGSTRDIVRQLRKAGFSLHLLCSLKRRGTDAKLTTAHLIMRHEGQTQTEVYLFDNGGSVSVYAHYEPDPSRPLAHLGGDKQSDGDVRGVVTDALR